MKLTRRAFLLTLPIGLGAVKLRAQGESSRDVKAQPKLPPSGRPFDAHFVDIAQQAGLVAPVIYGSPTHDDYILEATGCGCAFIDYDNDGWMDLFVLTGTRLQDVPAGTSNRLYHNNRDGTFTDVTERAGLSRVGWASSVCVGDYNNDGFDDIFCTYWGQNALYRNNGDGTFTDVTKAVGLWHDGPTRWGAGCTFIDYDRNGHLDLFVSNYVRFDLNKVPKPGHDVNCSWKGIPVECGPRGLPFPRQHLYRNNGNGTFTDVSEESGVGKPRSHYGMTAVCADLDEDGWPDIYVACDSTPSLLFMNHHDGTFQEQGILRGVALSDDGMEQAGMGIGLGDYNLDGHLDIYKTNFTDDTNTLYRNDGKGYFDDVTLQARLGVETRFTCWGTTMMDLDNDGYPDIFVVAGSVYPGVGKQLPQYPDKCPRMVYRNLGDGTFEELGALAGPAILEPHSSRGCAFGDFDNDGDVDVLIVNLNEPPSLLRNDMHGINRWLKVKLIGTKSNRSAIGARVLVHYGQKVQAQGVTSQASFYSANDPRLHFGLGAANNADIEIHWPSGRADTFKNVDANQLVTIEEGKGIVPSKGWPAKPAKPVKAAPPATGKHE